MRWHGGGGYTTLERDPAGKHQLTLHDPTTAATTVLVTAEQLTPQGETSPIPISDHWWSPDGKKLLVFNNTRRVWRQHSRGDFWVVDLSRGSPRRLGEGFDPTWLQFAKFSPDSSEVAYLYRNDIHVEDIKTGEIRKITEGGSETRFNGTFDWVYEEEWGLRDGFRWSPDGSWIAYWQIDSEGVGLFTLTDYTSDLYPKLKTFPYPKVGTTNPICRIGIVPARGGETRWLDLPGDPRDNYVAWMEWIPDSGELMLQRVNRRQDTVTVLGAVARSGEVREVMRDQDPAWIEICKDLRWLDGGKKFLWMSERDGWRHAWVVSTADGSMEPITPGDYDVIDVLHVDEESRWLTFIASPEDPKSRALYRSSLDGGPPQRLTPGNDPGSHSYDVSPDGRWARHTESAAGVPPRIEIISLPDHTRQLLLQENEDLRLELNGVPAGMEGFIRLDIGDGIEIDGWVLEPPDLDPAKKYPLIVYVYGEPAGSTVRNAWGGGTYLWHRLLAEMGFIVVSFDNRGTPAPRGRAWRKSVHRKIGIIASEDQAAALEVFLDTYPPYIDRDRIGVWGWSGGGSMSLNLIFRYPHLYSAAIAIAFVADQRYYDTIYQERYMERPQDNPDGFREGSPITHAHRLEGDLLLIYGTGDDNCHYQNCEALIDELVKHGKMFEVMPYPNRTHGISEGEGTTAHLYTKMARFWETTLEPGD